MPFVNPPRIGDSPDFYMSEYPLALALTIIPSKEVVVEHHSQPSEVNGSDQFSLFGSCLNAEFAGRLRTYFLIHSRHHISLMALDLEPSCHMVID
jgi:hypothetical protein